MQDEYQNNSNIREFIETHDLRNRNSDVHFSGNVTINTQQNCVNQLKMNIRINFNDPRTCATVKLEDYTLDPYIYPTEFDARFQKFIHEDQSHLIIEGKHSTNHVIGEYEVVILPIARTRE